MLRLRLLTAAAATALLSASSVVAQTAPVPPAPTPVSATPATPATPPEAAAPATQTPPSPQAAPAAQAAAPAAVGTVIEVLTTQGDFTTLLAALDQAQLAETLSTRPAVTIFAPTDAAFAALPEAERTRLMDPANAQALRTLLLYHVIVADVSSAQITGARGGVQTANGAEVMLDGVGEGIRIDAATVTRADIDASNGAVFAIDRVLNPAESMAPSEPAAAPAAAPATNPAPAPAPTATTRPATPGVTAPDGQPAATTTTIASPPVPNPTDGQTDPAPDPSRPTPPVDTPDPADTDTPASPAPGA